MINIVYHRDLSRVTIDGHANSAEKGKDIICASVTILAHTLDAFVNNLKGAGQTRYPTIELNEGNAVIDCRPLNRYKDAVKLVFDSICGGFDLLAQGHPQYIAFEIRGK